MARKDMMKGLMGQIPPLPPRPEKTPGHPRYKKGAIGAVSKSIDYLKKRAIIEVDARIIDQAGLEDRLGEDDGLKALMQSIETYGQQVPVLLRVSPIEPERYQIVFGRRRVAALKALGLQVKALVRDLSDYELIMAQGQENTARKDLTFIEKANFARQMRDAHYDRKIIGDALSMDKTLISRLLHVADTVPQDLIEAIGAAPSYGRDRWLKLAEMLNGRDLVKAAVGDSSDDRFAAVVAALAEPKPAVAAATSIMSSDGGKLAVVKKTDSKTTLTLSTKSTEGFDDWLVDNLSDIHCDWVKARRDG